MEPLRLIGLLAGSFLAICMALRRGAGSADGIDSPEWERRQNWRGPGGG
jgi:hypothetical protein